MAASDEHHITASANLFPNRVDHIYLIWSPPSESQPTPIYVGKSTRPGRALEHWVTGGSHNQLLRAMLAGRTQWPSVSVFALATPSWEDLAIIETTLIDIIFDDLRFEQLNGNRGDKVFQPRKLDRRSQSTPPELQNSILLEWANIGDGSAAWTHRLEAVSAMPSHLPALSDDPMELRSRYASAPFVHRANRDRFVELIREMTSADAPIRLARRDFFGELLAGFACTPALSGSLPFGRAWTFTQLSDHFNGDFVLTTIAAETLEDESGSERIGSGIGITEPSLRERASRWWRKSSTSTRRGKTIGSLLRGGGPQPEYLLATAGRPGLRIILGAWPLLIKDPHSGSVAREAAGELVEFHAVSPECWSPQQQLALRPLIGSRIIDTDPMFAMHGHGAKWIQREDLRSTG